jgi:hypothetical protein
MIRLAERGYGLGWGTTPGATDHTVPFLRRHPGYGGQDGTDHVRPLPGISCLDFGGLRRVATLVSSLWDKG